MKMLLPASLSAQLKSPEHMDFMTQVMTQEESEPWKHTLVCMDVSTGPGILAGLLGLG